jgi:hypothetical protein
MSDPKALLTSTWRQLVQRRLLPVAILLLAALVAIPVLLAKGPSPVAAPPAAPATSDTTTTAATGAPIVSLVSDGDPTKRRRVLGVRKNPFAPAPVKTAAAPATTTVTQTTVSRTPSTGGSSASSTTVTGTGGSATTTAPSSTTGAPVSQTPAVTPAPKHSYPLYSLAVRFGDSSGTLEKLNLARLKPLPSADNPIAVYLGISRDGKSAVFLLDDTVTAQGDGTCEPSPVSCETIHLREGDTEFLDVAGTDGATGPAAQYELDLVKIRRGATTSAAKAAHAKVSPAGRSILRARQADTGPLRYRYDVESGTLRKLTGKAWKAVVAQAAAALHAHL